MKRLLTLCLALSSIAYSSTVIVTTTEYLGKGDAFDSYEILAPNGHLISDEPTGFMGEMLNEGRVTVTSDTQVVLYNPLGDMEAISSGTIDGGGSLSLAASSSYSILIIAGTSNITGVIDLGGGTQLQLDSTTAGSGEELVVIADSCTVNVNASVALGNITSANTATTGNIVITPGVIATIGANGVDRTYRGNISGDGAFFKAGTGTLDLTEGTLSSTGQNQVINGRLKVTPSTLTNDTLTLVPETTSAEPAVEFNVTTDATWSGNIAGVGDFRKSGSAILNVDAQQNFNGILYIDAGTLNNEGNYFPNISSIIQDGGTYTTSASTTINDYSGTGTFTTSSGTTTTFNITSPLTLAASVNGPGGIKKTGSAAYTLSGTWGLTGQLEHAEGDLIVTGNLSTATLQVNTGTTLKGNGTVGATTILGTVAPGQSIGTLNVAGTFTQATGSVNEVEINGAGEADKIAVTGSAVINPGASLHILPIDSWPIPAGTRYTIMTATGGISGQYSTASYVTSDSAHQYLFTLTYNTNELILTIGNREPLQKDAAVITMTSDLSKQINGYQMDNVQEWLNIDMRNRVNCTPQTRFSPFIIYDHRGGGYRTTQYNVADSYALDGLTLGSQFNLIDNFGFGLAYGFTSSSIDQENSRSTVDATSNSIIAFFNYGCFHNFQFDAQLMQTFTSFRSGRQEIQDATSNGDYNGLETGVQARAAYQYEINRYRLLPMLKLRYTYEYVGDYREEGRVSERLSVRPDHMNQLYASIGLDASRPYPVASWTLRPHAGLYYLYQFLNDERSITTSYDSNFADARNLCISATGHSFGEFNIGIDTLKGNSKAFFDFVTLFGTHMNFTYDVRLGLAHSF